ncbi:solute carrier family 23 protein [Solitalea agri]|nr:solute carrier family 23 protein [Solitalea agri]
MKNIDSQTNSQEEIVITETTTKPVLDVHERPNLGMWLTFSIQHVFAMFGATILVPMLIGLNPSVALLTSGLGTLAYLAITKGKIPIYLGSSFAFITPFIALAEKGVGAQMLGCLVIGIAYVVMALIVRGVGIEKIVKLLPPVVTGPIVIVIGLSLAPTAVNMATLNGGHFDWGYTLVAIFTLAVTIIFTNYVKGFFGLIPVLMGIIFGYLAAAFAGLVDFSAVSAANWFAVPNIVVPFKDYVPEFSWAAVMAVIFVVIAPISEHVGNVTLLGKITGKNFIKDPGLDKSLLGDATAIGISSMLGGVPNTTYGENIGVMALTRVYSVFVIAGAAVLAIAFSFCGKISAVIMSIPNAAMGGVSLLLFGVIASGGLRMLIDNKINLSVNRNLVIVATILTIGIGGFGIPIGIYGSIHGVGLAAIVGVILQQILPKKEAGFGEVR